MTEPRPARVASPRHTAIVVAIVLGIAAYGIYAQATSHHESQLVEHRGSALPLYLSLLAAEWGLVRLVVVGIHRTGTRLRDLLGDRWSGPRDILRDIALGFGFWAAWTVLASLASRLLGPDMAKSIETLLPRDLPESVAWVFLSISAGICEEIVFRGYLMRQLHALWGNAWLAIAGQALIFGIGHGYQGVRNVVVITLLGLLYGLLAHWRRSVKPGMVAHAWTDVVGGLIAKRA
jgi:CAAX protease family protein